MEFGIMQIIKKIMKKEYARTKNSGEEKKIKIKFSMNKN